MEKVRGLQRSGTNLLNTVLRSCNIEHSRCKCHSHLPNGSTWPYVSNHRWQPCWKHWRVSKKRQTFENGKSASVAVNSLEELDSMTGRLGKDGCTTDRYVVVTKNPIAWIVSDAKYHKEVEKIKHVQGFLRRKSLDWTEYHQRWIMLKSLDPYRIRILPYEALLKDASSALPQYIGNDLIHANVSRCTQMMKKSKHIPQSGNRHLESMKQKYLSCKPAVELRHIMRNRADVQEDLQELKAALNITLLQRLGYQFAPNDSFCTVFSQ